MSKNKSRKIIATSGAALLAPALCMSATMPTVAFAQVNTSQTATENSGNTSTDTDQAAMSEEEKQITLSLTEMLQKAGTFDGLKTAYKYTEAHDVQATDLHTGDLVVKGAEHYVYVAFRDASGNAKNQLWAIDEANAVENKTDVTDTTMSDVYILAKEPAKYTAPSGLQVNAGDVLSAVVLPDGWSWDAPDTAVAEGGSTYDATYTPANTITETPAKVKLTVTGVKTPEVIPIDLPAANYDVVYKNRLTASAVTLPANWAFADPNTALVPGINKLTVTFTGDKSKTYSAPTDDRTITITASQLQPVINIPAITIEAGTSLSGSVSLPAVTGGSLVWVKPHDKLVPGTYTYAVNFVPDATGMYSAQSGIKVTVTVTQNHTGPSVPIKVPDDVYNVSIKKGAKVSDVVVLPANWAFADKEAVLQSGSHQYKVYFTGDKTKNYDHSIADKLITVTVAKKKVNFGKVSIVVQTGDLLKDSMLPASTAGKLHFDNPGKAMDKAGTYTVKAHFIPADPDTTEAMSIDVTVNVTDPKPDDKGKKDDKKDEGKTTDDSKKPDDSKKADSDTKGADSKSDDTKKDDGSKKSDEKADSKDTGTDKNKTDEKNTQDTKKTDDKGKKKDNTNNGDSDEKPIDKDAGNSQDKTDDKKQDDKKKTDEKNKKKDIDDMFVIDFKNKKKTDDNKNDGKNKDGIKDIKPDEILPISDKKNKNNPLPDLVITDATDKDTLGKLKEDHQVADLDVISNKKQDKKDTADQDTNVADTPDEDTPQTKKKTKTEKKKKSVSVLARTVVGLVFTVLAVGAGAVIYLVMKKKKEE